MFYVLKLSENSDSQETQASHETHIKPDWLCVIVWLCTADALNCIENRCLSTIPPTNSLFTEVCMDDAIYGTNSRRG